MTRRTVILGLVGIVALTMATAADAQTPAPSAAKKELVQRVLKAQQGDIEGVARSLIERPAAQMMQEAGLAIQRLNVAPDKREAMGKAIEAEAKKYVEDALPIVRERAIKIAPTTIGAVMEAKMSEDELKALLAWLDSPTYKKYTSLGAEMRNGFVQQLLREAGPLVEPKAQALDGRIRTILGVPPAGALSGSGSGSGSGAAPASRPAGK
jgi:hypothetical protein